MDPVKLRSLAPMSAWLALTGCAVAAGGTVGLHYTTDGAVRVQVELPLEVALVGSGTTAAEQSRPYLRAAMVPQLSYDVSDGTFDGGILGVLGPVFAAGGTWLAPALTVGGSGFRDRGSLDVGVTMDLELPRSTGASCDDQVFTNPLMPQVSLGRRVYDVNRPFSTGGGAWDVGIAAGVRRTVVLSCGGASTASPAPRR